MVGIRLVLAAAALAAAPAWEVVNEDIVSGKMLHDPGVWVAGKTDSFEACRQLCIANSSCTGCDWAGHSLPPKTCGWDSFCYFRSDGKWVPHVNGGCNHTAGRPAPPVTPVPPGQCLEKQCSDDSDCSDLPNCTWCRDDIPGKGHPQLCGGPPDASDCGTLPGPPQNASKPQYACIGDSVSKGIFGQFKSLVEPEWEAFHPSSNEGGGCGNTVRGKDCMPLWLDGDATAPVRQWATITFNFGLHDLAQDGELQTLDQYKRNLRNITTVLRAAPGAPRLFWVTSTPVPNVTLNPARPQGDVAAYNAAAQEVIDAAGIPTIDLYSFVVQHCGSPHYTSCPGFQKANNVHFEKAGYVAMAGYIYSVIQNATVAS